MKTVRPCLLLFSLASLATAGAESQGRAQGILVNPVKGNLQVHVRTNRDASGEQTPTYAPGNHLEFYTRVNRDAFVYLFNVDAHGQVTLLASNGLQAKGNFVKANTTRVFPRKGEPSTFLLTLPEGLNKVMAVASLKPLNVEQIAQFKVEQGGVTPVKANGQAGLAEALSIVVRPVQPASWTTDTAQYAIARRDLGALPVLDVQARKSQVTFDRDARLSEVFVAYADRLRSEGYRVLTARYGEGSASGVFTQAGAPRGQVVLEVRKNGRRFEVTVARRS